jgi:hypothetical protein
MVQLERRQSPSFSSFVHHFLFVGNVLDGTAGTKRSHSKTGCTLSKTLASREGELMLTACSWYLLV